MNWPIYHSGERIAVAHALTYSGEWMGDEFVVATIKSEKPITFSVGDYIEYRGERYYLNVDPAVQKGARIYSRGDAFVYDSIKFYSVSDELTRCKFLDYVLSENNQFYTCLPDFSFYCSSVAALADRIKANLDRIYTGEKTWVVRVMQGNGFYVAGGGGVPIDENLIDGAKNKVVTVNNKYVWDALCLAESEFGLTFICRNRVITIGHQGALLSKYFEYGKGKGLVKIEKTTDDTQMVVTRLRAYGNSTNLPTRYYFDRLDEHHNNMNCTRLMLPAFGKKSLAEYAAEHGIEWDGRLSNDVYDPYIDAPNADEIGVREATIYFDGSDNTEDIYPSVEWAGGAEKNNVVAGSTIEDDGIFEDGATVPNFKITIADIGFDIMEQTNGDTPQISMKDGMCGGRDFEVVSTKKVEDGYELELKRTEDSGLSLWFPYKDLQIRKDDKFVVLGIDMPDAYVDGASEELLRQAFAWLRENDKVCYKYALNVDPIFMQRQHDTHVETDEESIHDTIKAGDVLQFGDSDLGIDTSITIDKLEIKEGDNSLPQYSITIVDKKGASTLQRIQNQVDKLSSGSLFNGMNATGGIEDIVKKVGRRQFLSKTLDDVASGRITFEKGWQSKDAIDSFLNGIGTLLSADGRRLQTDNLEVRGQMKVMELIINRLTANEGDYVFTDSGTIDKLVLEDDGTYTATMRKRWDGDFTSFRDGDVIRGVINNIQSTGEHYTSWVRVASVNEVNNTLSLIIYPDSETPAGENHLPIEGMVINRWGNAITPSDGSYNERQTSWYISSSEGRIVFLQGVTKPILEDTNYAAFFGLPVDLPNLRDIGLNPNQPYVYAKGIAVEQFRQVDYHGHVIRTERDRGLWSLETASGENPYEVNEEYVDAVYHHGCKWQCLVNHTTQEPSYNATDWVCVAGNNEFTVEIQSSNGWGEYDAETFATTLGFVAKIYNEDVSSFIRDSDVQWTRDTGDIAEDNAWAVKRAGSGKTITLTVDDLPADHTNLKYVKFTVTVTLRDGENTPQIASDEIIIN